MALITKAEIDAKLALGERVFLNLSNQTEKDIDKPSESPVSNPVLPNPTAILGADGNAIGIGGKPIQTTAPVNGDFIRYDGALEKWIYTAASGGGGGGGGTTITVRATDGSPTNTTAILQFDEASGFVPSIAALETTNVALANIPLDKLAALTASRVLVTNGSGNITASTTLSSKLAHLDGVTSSIQAQLDTLAGATGITALTGDVTASGSGSVTATLANSGVSAGTYTKVTVNTKGLVTVGASLVSGDLPAHTHAFASQITGVAITSPTNNQVLQYNGTNWVNATIATGGNAGSFNFLVNFDGSGNPVSTSNLPSGWSTSIAGSEVTVTHNIGMPPSAITYFGLDTSSGSVWRYRVPTASNEAKYNNATMNTQFVITVNHSVTGASLSSSAKVNVIC